MAASTGHRPLHTLLAAGLALPLVAVGLELASVARLATERAATECALVTRNVARQLEFLANDAPDAPLEELVLEPRLQQVLDDAIAQAPSVLRVAVCDTHGVAVAASPSTPGTEHALPDAPLPKVGNLVQAFGVVWDLRAVDRVFLVESRISQSERPFAVVRVHVAATFLRDGVQSAFYKGVAGTLIFVGLVLVAGLVVSRLADRRLRVLEAGVSAMRAGHFDAAIPESGAEEFDRLTRELNLLGKQIQAEREQQDLERTLHRVADLLGDGILALGPHEEIVLLNAAAGQWLGIEARTSQARRLEALFPAAHPIRVLARELQGGGRRSLSVPLAAANGQEPLVAVGHRIEGGDAAEGGTLIEIKRAHEHVAIHSLIDQSKVLTRLGDMAAGVAHELRGRLQSLIFDLDAVMSTVAHQPEAAADQTRVLAEKVKSLDRVISGFLRLARLRPAVMQRLQLEPFVEGICTMMAADASLAGLDLVFEPGSVGLEVMGDEAILRQAAENVLRNAMQAQPSRSGRIVVRIERRADRARLVIADDGPGIAAEDLAKVFDLFYTTRPDGSGVGLTLVRQAVELLGGQVEIVSSPESGTEVTLSLPLADPDGQRRPDPTNGGSD